ncbi:unnamed protein product [Microthlaspi erraticum]|uniref:Uncharacterized protein n=1 Tax=Microthlaspi erraticum TaxID=1685480 RepID=A0A6D2K4U3_9BRAS|nr:unnamed protein product [Microthlaspi erraticum]
MHHFTCLDSRHYKHSGWWRWKPSDWEEKGVLVSNHPRVDLAHAIKVEPSYTVSKKRPFPAPPSNYDGIEETLQRLISDCTRTLSADLKAGFQKYDRQLAALTSTVAGMERSVKQLMEARLKSSLDQMKPAAKKMKVAPKKMKPALKKLNLLYWLVLIPLPNLNNFFQSAR